MNLKTILITPLDRADVVIDQQLGFQLAEVESRVVDVSGVETWKSRGSQVFQTPYAELQQMLEALALPPGAKLIDLGAAYGRLGLVVAADRPDLGFLGFEISPERVAEGRRVYSAWGLDPESLQVQDLASPSFVMPVASAYFIYDYGMRQSVEKTLRDLKQVARESPGGIQVVGRGRLSRDLIEREHPWLSQVHTPRHLGNFSIYQS